MSPANFLFSFLLPQKLNRRTNVVLADNGFEIDLVANLKTKKL